MWGLIKALVLSAGLLLSAFYAARLWFDAMVRREVIAQAAARGVSLRFERFDWSVSNWRKREATLVLMDSALQWPSFPNLSATLTQVQLQITLRGLRDVQVHALQGTGGTIEWLGSVTELQHQLQRNDTFPLLDLPLSLEQMRVQASPARGASPVLVLEPATLVADAASATLNARGGQLGSWTLGELAVHTTTHRSKVHFEVLAGQETLAFIDVALDRTQRFPELGVEAKLLEPALLLQLPPALARGIPSQLAMALGVRKIATGYAGKLSLVAEGWIPPHPIELSGFDFGKETRFNTRFKTDLLGQHVELTETSLEAGALRLDGGGRIERRALLANAQLDLQGELSCRQVAAAAATAHVGSVFGRFFREAARQFLRGSVAVRVIVDATLPPLAPPNVRRAIGVGCGLRPLRDVELLPLLDSLPSLEQGLPALTEKLEQLSLPSPAARPWPNLGELPQFEWRFPWQKQLQSAPQ